MRQTADLAQVCAWCVESLGATVDNTFGPDTNVYRVGEKIFAMVYVEGHAYVTLKASPEDVLALQAQYPEIRPGYYMSKKHWITIDLPASIPADEIHELIIDSHRIVLESLTRKLQAEIRGA